jgi:hypothetical protein
MHSPPTHRWDHQATTPGRRPGSLSVIVLCRYCGLLTIANAGSSPLRPGPCDGARPEPVATVWATRRPEATARFFWRVRGR